MLTYFGIYTEYADGHISQCQRKRKLHDISRAKIELQLLNGVDRAEMPLKHRLKWYRTLLESSNFDGYWTAVSKRFNLPDVCTVPLHLNDEEDDTDAEAEADSKLEDSEDEEHENAGDESSSDSSDAEDDPRDHPLFSVRMERPRPVKGCHECGSNAHTTEQHPEFDWADWVSDSSDGSVTRHKAKTVGKILFVGVEGRIRDEDVSDWLQGVDSASDPCTAWNTMNPRAEVEKDDAQWEDSPYGCQCRHRRRASALATAPTDTTTLPEDGDGKRYPPALDNTKPSGSKARGKPPRLSTAKSASKPKGVTKKKPTQGRKEKTPAQLKLVEAAITPAEASRDVNGSDAHVVEGYVSPRPERGQGVKRVLDESFDDEDDGPPTKKAKAGGGYVSPHGERGQGLKRMLEESSDDEDDGSPNKKAKVGGAVSVEGGRKKAPLKKNKGKGPVE